MRHLKSSTIIILLWSTLLVLSTSVGIFGQYKGSPVKRDKLLNVLRSKQLQTREIVNVINSNGVDFKVTPDVEAELVSAGARPEVIAATKANYRAAAVVKPTTPTDTSNNSTNKFNGQPLTLDAIVTLLQNGVGDVQVRKNVGSRGVNFKLTSAEKTEIKNAGGTVALLNLIEASYTNPNQNSASNNTTTSGASGSDKYDTLVEKAVYQYDTSRDVTGAISTLKEAVELKPTVARAYQQLGFAYLYGLKNFTEAEKYMQQAIDLGGSAVFRVFHDHGALMTDTCQGSLYIAKDTVHFESDDNIHTFETTDDNIKEAKVNGKFSSMFNVKLGSFKIALKNGDSSKNFNFAPLTNDAQESTMIVKLIGKRK